jgi:hypothetical protein
MLVNTDLNKLYEVDDFQWLENTILLLKTRQFEQFGFRKLN